MYDIIIIGSGPGGHSAAISAAKRGKKVAVIERGELGGVCVNWGCMPTKSLLKSAEVYESVKRSAEFGVDVVGEVAVNLDAMVTRSRGIASMLSGGIAASFKKYGIDVIVGEGRLLGGGVVGVGDDRYEAESIILATGARSRRVGAIPVDGKRVITSREALALRELPSSMVVVGSGAIGLEFASFYSSLGVAVTIVEYVDRIAPLEDKEISANLERAFRKRKVKLMTSTKVLGVTAGDEGCSVEVEGKKGVETLSCDVVLSAVGIQPNVEGLGLEELGVEMDGNFIDVNFYNYSTSVEGVYAIGDIVRTPALAHVAMLEAEACVARICGEEPYMDYELIPSCVYTFAEVASVGVTEDQAKEIYEKVSVGKFAMVSSGKAAVAGHKDGLVKLVFAGDRNALVGAHLMGHNVTEMIAGLTVMIGDGVTQEELLNSCHPHPTISEAIQEAARALVNC